MATPVKYQQFALAQFNGNSIDFDAGGLKAMLVGAGYTPNYATDTFKSSVTSEVTGTNYTARGATLANVVASQTGGTVSITADSITWLQSASGFTGAVGIIVYNDTGVDSTSRLITYTPFATAATNTTGDVVINWNNTLVNGIVFNAS